MAREGQITLIVSDLLLRELASAPEAVRGLLDTLPEYATETFSTNLAADDLRRAYLVAGVVGYASDDDAQHVANATVAHADVIVSWNFRHIVHFDKIRQYNAVNLREGYGIIEIRSPREIV